MTVWQDIPGYEGRYKASICGQVKSNKKTLTPCLGSSGSYYYFHLYKDGKRKCFLAQRLLLTTFIRPPLPNEEACHNDGNWTNNSLSNLRWASKLDNEKDKFLHGTSSRGSNNSMAILNEDQVRQIKEALEKYQRGDIIKLAHKYGVSRATISDIKNHRKWKHI